MEFFLSVTDNKITKLIITYNENDIYLFISMNIIYRW